MDWILLLISLVILGLECVVLLRQNSRSSEPDRLAAAEILGKLGSVETLLITSDRSVRDEMARGREESGRTVLQQFSAFGKFQTDALSALDAQVKSLTQATEARLEQVRNNMAESMRQFTDANARALKNSSDSLVKSVGEVAALQKGQLDSFSSQHSQLSANAELKMELLRESLMRSLSSAQELSIAQVKQLTETITRRLEEVRAVVDARLKSLQEDNGNKLEAMRATVDEKLQGTLEKRLGDSFRQVSDRLEQVHKGLGEMQTLASGVGDLKKVLTNVRVRGNWGEVQLGNLLEQTLTRDQYALNVPVTGEGRERVEFAIKLPGRTDDDKPVWLPIDAKFPQEDYQRLVDASERSDSDGVEAASKALADRVWRSAKDIRDKYIRAPMTTDFGILFLPTEGLYAEVLRRPGLADELQRELRIVIAGPTTLAALLNSLQMGFRTLAIQKQSSEVWKVLGGVKSDFGKFSDILDSVKKKLDSASSTIEDAQSRTVQIAKKLRKVEALPPGSQEPLLGTSLLSDHEA